MADKSNIEWCDATWNPTRGCSRVSPGCGGPNHQGGCYAEKVAARFSDPGQPYHGLAERTEHGGRWTGKVVIVEKMLGQPRRWREPRRIFVNSMSDLFHENLPQADIDRVFDVMEEADWHTYMILTKRSRRQREYFVNRYHRYRPAPKHIWAGVSVENQEVAEERIRFLLSTPVAVRFLSCEPLLGPVSLKGIAPDMVGWVICGGESGPRARPMNPHWAKSMRDECQAGGVPFFFKQWGEWAIGDTRGVEKSRTHWFTEVKGYHYSMVNVGKRRAGRLLDGRTWDEFPKEPA